MTALFVLICISAPMLAYPWWPDIPHWVRWRRHLWKKRLRRFREAQAVLRRLPVL